MTTVSHAITKTKRLHKICISATLALVLAGCGQQTKDVQQQVQQHLKQSQAYTSQGQYRAAMIEAKNALQKAPDNEAATLVLAKILVDMGQYNQASDLLEKFNAANATNEYFELLARAYNGYGKYRSALDTINSSKNPNAAATLLVKAEILVNLNRLDEAESTYATLLKNDPENVRALLGNAQIFAQRNEFHKSFQALDRLKEQDPNNAETLLFEANLAIRDGDLTKAESLLTDALQNIPTTDVMLPLKASVLSRLSNVLSRQGRPSEAMIYTKILSAAFPGMEIATGRYEEALALAKNNEFREAQKVLAEIIADYPGFSKAKELLATINYLHGDLEPAEEYFANEFDPELATATTKEIALANSIRMNNPEDVIKLLQNNDDLANSPTQLGLYAIAALKTGQVEAGVSALNSAIALAPDNPRFSILLANHYNSTNPPSPKQALAILESAYAKTPNDISLLRTLSLQYLLMGQRTAAEQVVNKALNSTPKSADVLILAAQFNQGLGQTDKAFSYFKAATKTAPENAQAWLGLGAVELLQNHAEAAANAFDKAISLAPDNTAGYKGLIAIAQQQGTIKSGTQKIELLFSENKSPSAAMVLAEYFATFGDEENAQKWAQAAEAVLGQPDPNLRGALAYRQGLYALRSNDFETAKNKAAEGLSYSPQSENLTKLLIQSEIQDGNNEAALKLIETLGVSDPATASLLKGSVAQKQGNTELALQEFYKAWDFKANNSAAQKIYRLLSDERSPQEATKFLQSWLTLLPNSPSAQITQATELLEKNDYSAAIPWLEKALATKPNTPFAWNNLAWAYLETGNAKAEETARTGLALAPNNATILDTLGWILVKNGELAEGTALLEQAAKLAPQNTVIQEHLKAAKKQ